MEAGAPGEIPACIHSHKCQSIVLENNRRKIANLQTKSRYVIYILQCLIVRIIKIAHLAPGINYLNFLLNLIQCKPSHLGHKL